MPVIWLLLSYAAVFQPGKIYEIKRINDLSREGISAVVVNSSYFIYFPTTCTACVRIDVAEDGGMRKIGTFGSEFYDEDKTGLHIKVVGVKNGKIKLAIDYESKPSWFDQETSEYVDD